MSLLSKISENIPTHVAIIMDGNGRWAKKRGEAREFGHKNGVNSVQKIIKAAINTKIKSSRTCLLTFFLVLNVISFFEIVLTSFS